MEKVAVLGAGSWGLVLSKIVLEAGFEVWTWDYDPERVRTLAAERQDPHRLPGFRIPQGVHLTPSLEEALSGVSWALLVVPSHGFRETLRRAKEHLPHLVLSATKGLELGTGLTMSQVFREECPGHTLAVLSGPTIAREVAQGLPTSAVVASEDEGAARRFQETLSGPSFRLYRGSDVLGVELGGALKNVLAIAVGIADGIGVGDNARGALIARGLAEMARLVVAAGGKLETVFGLAGLGDAVTTSYSPHSRNRTFGELVGRGMPPDEAVREIGQVVEGINAAREAVRMAQKLGVSLPITEVVYSIIMGEKEPRGALRELMSRPLKEEFYWEVKDA